MRSEAENDSFLLATTNPDMDSWVYNWVSWYLDEDGYFDEEKLGVIRYFVIMDDAPIFGDTEEELAKAYPELCYVEDPNTGEDVYVPPMSFCFIGGTIFDNPALIKANPKYLSALKAQTKVNRARLLDGCWHARAEGSNYFERSWLHKLDKIPYGCVEARGWDLASEEPSDKNMHPDFTASVKMLKTEDNEYVIVGNYDNDTKHKRTSICGRLQQRPGQRDKNMLKQAKIDGDTCTVVLPVDPGAAGKVAFREQSKKFIKKGFKVKSDPMPNNKSKLTKFEPFSSAAQSGLVSIVESSFPNKETIDAFYKELESFDGERSTRSKKDDWADATASVFNYLTTAKRHKAFTLPNVNSRSMLNKHRNRTK